MIHVCLATATESVQKVLTETVLANASLAGVVPDAKPSARLSKTLLAAAVAAVGAAAQSAQLVLKLSRANACTGLLVQRVNSHARTSAATFATTTDAATADQTATPNACAILDGLVFRAKCLVSAPLITETVTMHTAQTTPLSKFAQNVFATATSQTCATFACQDTRVRTAKVNAFKEQLLAANASATTCGAHRHAACLARATRPDFFAVATASASLVTTSQELATVSNSTELSMVCLLHCISDQLAPSCAQSNRAKLLD